MRAPEVRPRCSTSGKRKRLSARTRLGTNQPNGPDSSDQSHPKDAPELNRSDRHTCACPLLSARLM